MRVLYWVTLTHIRRHNLQPWRESVRWHNNWRWSHEVFIQMKPLMCIEMGTTEGVFNSSTWKLNNISKVVRVVLLFKRRSALSFHVYTFWWCLRIFYAYYYTFRDVCFLCITIEWCCNIILSTYLIYLISNERKTVRCWTYKFLMIRLLAWFLWYKCETVRRWTYVFFTGILRASGFMNHVGTS